MRPRGRTIFTLLVLFFFGLLIWEAKDWRFRARLYPWTVGIPMLLLAVVELFKELRRGNNRNLRDTPVDFQFSQTMDGAVALRRTISIFSWMIAFFMALWLIGFYLAIPALVFFYLKIQSRERWGLSIALTVAAWLLFWGLFDQLLHLPFPDGQITAWLQRAMWESPSTS